MRPHIQYNSPVVLTFALLSLGALALGWATGGWTTLHLFCFYRSPHIIFWAINFKKFKCAPGEITIPKGKRFSTIILNVGMILYCLFWIIQIILQLFA